MAIVVATLGATSIVGLAGLVSQTGFDSEAAVEAMKAGSSMEHETSSLSAGVVSRERVCARAVDEPIPSARKITKALGNSFGQTINGETPSPSLVSKLFLLLKGEGSTAKRPSHLSV